MAVANGTANATMDAKLARCFIGRPPQARNVRSGLMLDLSRPSGLDALGLQGAASRRAECRAKRRFLRGEAFDAYRRTVAEDSLVCADAGRSYRRERACDHERRERGRPVRSADAIRVAGKPDTAAR